MELITIMHAHQSVKTNAPQSLLSRFNTFQQTIKKMIALNIDQKSKAHLLAVTYRDWNAGIIMNRGIEGFAKLCSEAKESITTDNKAVPKIISCNSSNSLSELITKLLNSETALKNSTVSQFFFDKVHLKGLLAQETIISVSDTKYNFYDLFREISQQADQLPADSKIKEKLHRLFTLVETDIKKLIKTFPTEYQTLQSSQTTAINPPSSVMHAASTPPTHTPTLFPPEQQPNYFDSKVSTYLDTRKTDLTVVKNHDAGRNIISKTVSVGTTVDEKKSIDSQFTIKTDTVETNSRQKTIFQEMLNVHLAAHPLGSIETRVYPQFETEAQYIKLWQDILKHTYTELTAEDLNAMVTPKNAPGVTLNGPS